MYDERWWLRNSLLSGICHRMVGDKCTSEAASQRVGIVARSERCLETGKLAGLEILIAYVNEAEGERRSGELT